MTNPNDVNLLAQWMSGDFSNLDQASENPPFFAHIRVAIRPFYHVSFPSSGQWFYLEQAYNYALHQPYRTAVFQLYWHQDHIVLDNYKPIDAPRLVGAARQPEKLAGLTYNDVEKQLGCSIRIDRTDRGTFVGKIEPGKKCIVWRDGKESYLQNEFEISETRYSSLDRGLDPVTDQRVWGSIAGPFEFVKITGYPINNSL
ncbi:MAG: chorismate-binding protein [Cyanobacteria bacterium M5B4]|nr:chromophore lyase CpcT/CpeT [Cyanobacteria bacterium KgW148]PLS69778.1 MAG: chorismate-binding protein [Cyanobacteria bacterium M5B4]